ncbi:phosphopantetheine-binding protein [Actinosynnema sp. NPDC059797]
MLATTEVRALVHEQITALLAESGDAPAITGAEQLPELGVSSLMLARLIVALELELGVDPFAADLELSAVRTVDDMVSAYEAALAAAG